MTVDLPDEPTITLAFAPVSLQGGAESKGRIRRAITEQASRYPRIFVGEVQIEVEWLLHEDRRWNTPGVLRTPDLDNIFKPLLDGLCGPEGLLIDDCQVQTIQCSWIDWPDRENQQVSLRVRSLQADDSLERGTVSGLRMSDGMCLINTTVLSPGAQLRAIRLAEASLSTHEELLERGVPSEDARYVLPVAVARRFHPSQLRRHGFEVRDLDDYVRELEPAEQQSPG